MAMAIPKFDLRIGTKLALIQSIGVLLVVGMIANAVYGSMSVNQASETATTQQLLALDLSEAKSDIRIMAIQVRDIRLAQENVDIQTAVKNLETRQASASKLILDNIPKVRVPENKERLQKAATLLNDYAVVAKQVAGIRSRVMGLDVGSVRLVTADEEAARLAREKITPLARQLNEAIDKAVENAQQTAKEETAHAQEASASAQQIGWVIGGIVLVIMLGSAAFGSMSIARPLRRMASVLVELTHDRIVDVPFTQRKDEIGDIARATDIFKDSIAEKVANFRIKTGLDNIASNVMMTDESCNITYTNKAMASMAQEAEADLRRDLAQFDAGKLLGSSLDIFYKNSSQHREMLAGLTASHEEHIAISNRKYQVVTTPVIDKNGTRLGYLVDWKDETAEKAIETEVSDIVSAAVAGDFNNRISVDGKTGFMLNLTNSVNSLCETISTVLNDLVTMFSALAQGDLTKRIDADYQGTFGQLKDDANAMAEKLTTIVSQIKAGTGEVASAAAEISAGTTDLSQRTEEQAASLEQTSASMEEISATVKKNAENAQQANQSAGTTREVASRGGEVVAQAVTAMSRIEESSRKISDIISVIDEIARQTNLLALNAAVEAARAGDAGRGFAVVASEVRSLAQRSSQAAKDIKDLINNSTTQVKDGVDLVNRCGQQLKEIVSSINGVAAIVSEIASASAEQASGIDQVNKALTQMDEVTQQNSALVEENAAAAKTLEQQAGTMAERVEFFRLDESASATPHQARKAVPAAAPIVSPKPVQRAPKAAATTTQRSNGRGPVGRMQSALATAIKDDPDWKEF
jgi:methyl-accepting chemotaxis protein